MAELLKVTQRKNASGLDYTIFDVKCPKEGENVSIITCKACDHCRLFLGDSVKCSYKRDKEREDRPFIHAAYIL